MSMLIGVIAGLGALVSPYFGAPFTIKPTPKSLGQGADWNRDGTVLATLNDSAGIRQVYRLKVDGSAQRCLTCRTIEGPNGIAHERPQGDWILFHSYGAQPVHTGGPGLGGYGGDLYVMRPDGSRPYRLTTDSDPGDGKPYTADGVAYDNFHAHFSPNGKRIVWTHTEAHPLSQGGQTWSILVGEFRVRNGRPSLQNVQVVGKPYGAYETQPWAPDGSGFLFSAAGGNRSPYQATAPGWGNMQLYFMRIEGRGASIEHPRVTKISDDMPAYEEQAIFTPDMRTVIMMSNRSHTVRESWFNLIVAATQRISYDAPDTGSTQTIQFLADFIGPNHFNADLYAVDVRTKAIRQLTHLRAGVIPEFYWDYGYRRILFANTGSGINSGAGPLKTFVGRFRDVRSSWRRIPEKAPRALYGQPVKMSRVGGQAQTIRDAGPTDNTPVAAKRPDSPVPAFPHRHKSGDRARIPSVSATYVALWLGNLSDIYRQSGASFTTPPVLQGLGQFGG